jgi:hypothetical protein
MKKMIVLTFVVVLFGCGGSLSDEQRKRLREGMEQQKIVQLSDQEIVTAALDQGKAIANSFRNIKSDTIHFIDSLSKRTHAHIRWIVPGKRGAADIENQLIEAYVLGMATGSLQDNIQKIRTDDKGSYDSLLFSRPIITKLPDGADKLEGVWNIYLSKKDVILSISKK